MPYKTVAVQLFWKTPSGKHYNGVAEFMQFVNKAYIYVFVKCILSRCDE